MPTVDEIHEYLCAAAPVGMKLDFDNVGFLVGQAGANISKILVSLDITHEVITEAIEAGAGLIVSHHPLFFSLKSVTDKDVTGRKVVRLLSGGISAICMHTNLDAAVGGTNDMLAAAAGIAGDDRETELLFEEGRLLETGEAYSYGRVGRLERPCSMSEYLSMLKTKLKTGGLRYHDAGREVFKVAVVGGSGGSDLHHAIGHGCDTFVTADIKYDVFLEAKEAGINLIDGDHFCTENLVTGAVASLLRVAFPAVEVEVSQKHTQTVKFY